MNLTIFPKNWRAHRQAVASVLNQRQPATVLDIACGLGWLPSSLSYGATVDGMDFFCEQPEGYRAFAKADFNLGVPDTMGQYDAAVCCEAMGYLQNPGMFLASVRRHLNTGGTFILSVPNPTYAGARVTHLIQGAPRSYSEFVENIHPDPHMPWLALGVYQLWLLLGLNGFAQITVHEVDEPKPRHAWERLVGMIAKGYIRRRLRKAQSDHERELWTQALCDQAIYGRQLVVSAVAV